MAKVPRRVSKEVDMKRRWSSVDVDITPDKLTSMTKTYQKRAESRMKTFYLESQRMNTKLPELLAKAAECGITITKFQVNSVTAEDLDNYRKRTRGLIFNVEGNRFSHKIMGTLQISPASMKLSVNSPDLPQATTKNGFGLPLFKITYYRTLNVRDNYLIAISGGGWRGAETKEETTELVHEEIPF